MLDQLFFWVGLGGTVFVVASLLGGGGESDLEVSAPDAAGLDADVGVGDSAGLIPSNLLSLRTATFFCTFFGWSGFLSLKLLGTTSLGSLAVALPTGFLCAFIGAKTLEVLRRSEASSSYSPNDLLGKEADVTLPIGGEQPGRIRCYVKGSTIEYKALALFPSETFKRQEKVLIVEEEDGIVKVARGL